MKANLATATLTPAELAAYDHRSPFDRIVCGVDGGESALEAVRQAAALAGPSTTIDLVAVSDDAAAARDVLDDAMVVLAHSPARVVTRTIGGHPVWKALLAEASGADLLVVGRHGASRMAGLLIGSTASNAAHRARVPVLIAAQPPDDLPFPARILVAADGPDRPERAVTMAARISEHAGSDVTLLRVDWAEMPKRAPIANAIAELERTTGRKPFEIIVGGNPHRAIAHYAKSEQASLVILGSRRLRGLPALRSVSERVAHEAPCSVLIMRGLGAA